MPMVIKDDSLKNKDLKSQLEASEMVQRLISMLSTTADLKHTVREALGEIGKYMNAERTYLFRKAGEEFYLAYEWSADGVPPLKGCTKGVTKEMFPECYAELAAGNIFLDEEPFDPAAPEKSIYTFFRQNKVHISSAAPIFVGGEYWGHICVDNAPRNMILTVSRSISFFCSYLGIAILNYREHEKLLKINEDIRSSREVQFQLMDAISCGVYYYTYPQLELFGLNEEAKRIIEYDGISDEKAAVNRFYEMIHKDDRAAILEAEKKLVDPGDEIAITFRVNGKNGIKHIRSKISLREFLNGQKYIINSLLDVTEEMRLTNSLRIERQSCREALMNNCEYSFFLDLTEGLIHEEFITANEINIIKTLGLELPVKYDEMTKRYLEVFQPRFLEPEMAKNFTCAGIIDAYNRGITNVVTEYYSPVPDIYTRANGLISRDEETGHLNVFIIAKDITSVRKLEAAAQDALQKENERLSNITGEMTDLLGSGILAYTLPDRRILLLNKEARRMFDVPDELDVVSGPEIMSRVMEEDHKSISQIVGKIKNIGEGADFVFRNVKKDGSIATIRCNTRLLSFSNGQVYVLSSLNEITEQVAFEQRLEEERRQYRNALTMGCTVSFTTDMTEGIISSDIITKSGHNVMKDLGISAPAFYDDLARAWFDPDRIETSSEGVDLLRSRKRLLSAFKQGISTFEIDYIVKARGQYIHSLVMVYKIEDHVEATFVFYDNSKKMAEEKKRIRTIESLGKIYEGLCYISIPDDRITAFKQEDEAAEFFPEDNSYSKFAQDFIKNVVSDEYADKMKKFFDPETIRERLSDTDIIRIEFRRRNYKRTRINVVASERDANGDVTAFVLAGYDIVFDRL